MAADAESEEVIPSIVLIAVTLPRSSQKKA